METLSSPPVKKSFIQEVLEQSMPVRSYSGRGMCGRYCLAVEADSLGEMMVALFECGTDSGEGLSGEECAELRDAFQEMKTDSLGRGTIFYFPSLQYVASPEDEEEDEINGVTDWRQGQAEAP